MIETAVLVKFLQFGLLLNVIALFVHTVVTFVSAYRMGLVKSFESSQIGLKVLNEWKLLKRNFEPIRYYASMLSLFIPFYAFWQLFNIFTHMKSRIPYFELSVIIKMTEIEELKKKYNC
jgi:hypothetical protein